MATDPVCKMEVEESKATATATYEGKVNYFYALGCQQAFEKNPGKYVPKKQ